MEPDIKSLSAEALRALIDNLANAKEFALAQAPDICRHAIAWQITKGWLFAGALVAVVLLVVGLILAARRLKWDVESVLVFCFILFFPTLILLVATIVEGLQAVQAVVAPKLFLLEYFRNLVK